MGNLNICYPSLWTPLVTSIAGPWVTLSVTVWLKFHRIQKYTIYTCMVAELGSSTPVP